ncbi:methyltransferase [Skermanella stibiiresistens SB22]|uniref:Methyltransferase n=1 Tax=Skermanella stibiiresistens SB22 TaxID=1385369 RepID=W9GYN3_9PROT|nr:SAM-dependent methyltransferase [Skermanella stibiiresistens]EWY37557.1 methyltransferase [Skermanella stibiiresistens SB22]
MKPSLPGSYFDDIYRRDPDPWRFATSDYEAAKYQATLDALTRPRYGRAFEIGCSIGVLTRQLATRCDALLAVDVSPLALEQATARNADLPQVSFARMAIPNESPSGTFDLIVMSEVGYYLSMPDLELAADTCRALLNPGGELVLVHYIRETDYPLTGDETHDFLLRREGFSVQADEYGGDYRLSVLKRTG